MRDRLAWPAPAPPTAPFLVRLGVRLLVGPNAALVLRSAANEGFDVVQACNPPDTYWALAVPFKLFAERFVFDQHDLCSEVYASRFDSPSPILRRLLLMLERATYATADHVIATGECYRETAIARGRVQPDRVTVVRNGPDPDRFRRREPVPDWRRANATSAHISG